MLIVSHSSSPGQATASSEYQDNYKPDDVINGVLDDFMHTTNKAETGPWVNIVLPTMVRVTKIVLTNRGGLCHTRLFYGTSCDSGVAEGSVFDGPNQGDAKEPLWQAMATSADHQCTIICM